jgi:hypothetical protein
VFGAKPLFVIDTVTVAAPDTGTTAKNTVTMARIHGVRMDFISCSPLEFG